jgi:Protein of unknown function (DUF2637)
VTTEPGVSRRPHPDESPAAVTGPVVDRRIARAEQRRRDADAAAERRLRVAAENAALEQRIRTAARADAAQDAARRRAEAARRQAARRRTRQAAGAWLALRVAGVRRGAPALWSSTVYLLAVATAAAGQVSIAVHRGWPLWAGCGTAIFIEGLALAMALTAREARLRGEAALAPRVLTWVAAIFASTVNVQAHRDDLFKAAVFGAASLFGIILWEIRSGDATRDRLRGLGLVSPPRPPRPRLGVAYRLRYPAAAWAATSACIADPTIITRDGAITAGARLRADRAATRTRAELLGIARTAARRAAQGDDPSEALAALRRLADLYGHSAPPVPGAAIHRHDSDRAGPPAATPAGHPSLPAGSAPTGAVVAVSVPDPPAPDLPAAVPAGPGPPGDDATSPAATGTVPYADVPASPTRQTSGTPRDLAVPADMTADPQPLGAGDTARVPRRTRRARHGQDSDLKARMLTWAVEQRAAGRAVTGAELDKEFGTSDYGRRILRDLTADPAPDPRETADTTDDPTTRRADTA